MAAGPLRVVFMGTPSFAVPVLEALAGARHHIVGVFTRPDRPAGRGRRTTPPPLKEAALALNLPVFQPASLRRDPGAVKALARLEPQVIVVAAYGLFLPKAVLDLPPLSCLNLHPSLLPRYRGPSPVATAILNGDAETGVTIIVLDEGMDTGPVVAQRRTSIGPEERADTLTERLFRLGAELLVETLPAWAVGEITPQPQDESQASVTRLLKREDGLVDWRRSAAYIARQVRAYHPWPGTYTLWRGRTLKVLDARAVEESDNATQPGVVVLLEDGRVAVGTGEGLLALDRLQLEGRRAVTAAEFIRGHRDFVGSHLGE